MIRISTLSVLIASLLFATVSSAQHTYINNGTSSDYNLSSGDSLYISSGTYTGKINSFNSGAKITIAANATFQPSTFSNPKGSLVNMGTVKFTIEISSNDGFQVRNNGLFWVTKSVTLNGSGQSWTNSYGATMKLDKGFTINNANSITNVGTITTDGNVVLNSGASMTNKNILTIGGNYTQNSSQVFNGGKMYVTGSITFNSGAVMNNVCRLIADGGITNNSNSLSNYGLLWSTATHGATTITNSGTITNGSQARIKSVNFTNWGTLTGSGQLYFTGVTTNGGTTGVSGNTADTLKIYDVTRTASNIFDVQGGTIRPNTVYRVLTAPDTTGNYATCSSEYVQAPLAITWNYFYVNSSNTTPSLYWSATQTAGAVYEVQRSYDGVNYSSITSITAKATTSDYSYTDNSVNTQAAIVYYRIKGTENDGVQKMTETRVVRFAARNGISIQTFPNPFTNQFSVSYTSAVKETVVIKVFNMTGQVQVTKNVTVSNGLNTIAIPESASMMKGVYLVQVSNDTKVIASEKIIKQ